MNAGRIDPLGIATNAGELFVEWGLSLKKRSRFPHTIMSELTNEWIGYEPTAQAFQHEGYEALVGVNVVSLEGGLVQSRTGHEEARNQRRKVSSRQNCRTSWAQAWKSA